MKLNTTSFCCSILGASLALAANAPLIAANQSGQSLPQQPNHGSMQVSTKDECDMAKLSHLAIAGPTQAVEATMGSTSRADKVIETKLKADNQFLVWEVKSVNGNGTVTTMDVDAGTGEVLAMHQEQNNGQGSQVNGGNEDNGQGGPDNGPGAQVNGGSEDNGQGSQNGEQANEDSGQDNECE